MTADLLILCERLRSFDREAVRSRRHERVRHRRWLFCLTGVLMPIAVLAQDRPGADKARIGRDTDRSAVCVEIDIAGHRAGHLDCAAARLEKAAEIARDQAATRRTMSVTGAGSPDPQTGVANTAASRLRMGRNLGVSARPARPTLTPVNPMGPRR